MTLKDRLILIADLAYRLRQVDGSAGYDASMCLRLGESLDAQLQALHEKLGMPYTKKMSHPGRILAKFSLQKTKSFPEGAPQRENYDTDDHLFRAEEKYQAEWREEYKCPGCDDPACPQCGWRPK
jgi:hypothetical protein